MLHFSDSDSGRSMCDVCRGPARMIVWCRVSRELCLALCSSFVFRPDVDGANQ